MNDPDQDNASFVVIKFDLVAQDQDAMDPDHLPDLAMAEHRGTVPAHHEVVEVQLLDIAADQDATRKAYWYRGQNYYKD